VGALLRRVRARPREEIVLAPSPGRLRRYFTAPREGTDPAAWTARRLETLDRLLALLALPTDATARARRDAPTAALLRRVAEVWHPDRFEDALSAETDLLIQVEEVLHAVPIPYLPAKEGFLFEAVRSTRCVLSTVLNGWLAGQDRDRVAVSSGGRGLMLSWFDPGDSAAFSSVILRSELAKVAGDWDWRSAEGDIGTHATLAAVSGGSLRLAVVCGHGHDKPSGVRLGDGVWGGARVYGGQGTVWHETPGATWGTWSFSFR